MSSKILLRRGTAAQWASANPILGSGELGVETDTLKFKIGNGTSTWTQLTSYANITPSDLTSAINGLINAAPSALDTLNELAAAINNDSSFSTTVNNLLSGKVSKSGGDTITAATASTVGLIIKGDTSQTANLQEWYNTSNVLISWVRRDGLIAGQIQSPRIFQGSAEPNSATGIPLIVKGAVSQTGDLQQWQDSSGNVLATLKSSGTLVIGGTNSVNSVFGITLNNKALAAYYTGNNTSYQTVLNFTRGNTTGTWMNIGTTGDAANGLASIDIRDGGNTQLFSVGYTGNTSILLNSASSVGLTIKGAASQTVNLQEWQNSAGTVLTKVRSDGQLNIGGAVSGTTLGVLNIDPAWPALKVVGNASQTANLQQWQNSSGGVLAQINASGQFGTSRLSVTPNAAISADSRFFVSTTSATDVGTIIRGFASQTADLQQWQTSTGSINGRVDNNGTFWIGTSNLINYGYSTFAGNNAGYVPIIIIGAPSQTADLQQWKNSAGTVLSRIASNGRMVISSDTEASSGMLTISQAATNAIVLSTTSTANDYGLALNATGSGNNTSIGISFSAFASNGYNGVATPGGAIWFTRSGSYSLGYLSFLTRSGVGANDPLTERMRIGDTGTVSISGFTSASQGLIIKGAASQTADLQQWQDTSGTVLGSVVQTDSNNMVLRLPQIQGKSGGYPWISFGSSITNTANQATDKPLVVKGAASQTANLTEWQDSSGTVLTKVDSSGNIGIGAGTTSLNYGLDIFTGSMRVWNGVTGAGQTGTIYLGDGSFSKTYGSGWTFNGGITTNNEIYITGGTLHLGDGYLTKTSGNPFIINSGFWVNGSALTIGGSNINYNNSFTVYAGSSTRVGAVIQGAASQTANLQEWQNSTGTILARVSSGGAIVTSAVGVFGSQSAINNSQLTVLNQNSLYPAITVKAAVAQTANLQEWQNSSGSLVGRIEFNGKFVTAANIVSLASIHSWNIITLGTNEASYSSATISASTRNAENSGLVIRGVASQTANLTEWQDSAGTILTKVDASGNITAPSFVKSGGTSSQYLMADGSTNSTVATTSGGTGLTSYTTGDILYASATNTLSKLSAGTDGYLLTLSSGVPTWAAAPISLPPQTGNNGKYLTTDGTSASWATIPVTSQATPTVFGTVLGKTDTSGTTAIGHYALNSNVSGNENTAVGRISLYSNTSGSQNIGLGVNSVRSNTSGSGNVGLGAGALYSITTTDQNVAVGTSAGYNLVSGSNNIIIGSNAQASTTSISNEITIGNSSITKFRIPGLKIEWDKDIEIMNIMGAY